MGKRPLAFSFSRRRWMDGGAAKKGSVPSMAARVALLACAALMTSGCSRGEQGLVLG
ncbi:MAG: hypothetical protein AVDCRST_MAG05-1791 [uncultured Rubrobacteraceae bacterium]|uniref:Uncharacterized protein n=1 Tax=uncultured Rubrobacteraceae bacterium TaxID=349277 RepID=A0A6J4SAU2_9ACTN|nr:MAG: hypothetical protein AVDCRST_MAG05-1791 [uncultured Rubrobacteraceae bacterium]